jgi:hypothetical protein
LAKLNVFIDESGDLGFDSTKSSRTFIVAYVITADPERTRIDIKRLRKKLRQKRKLNIEEFKFARDSEVVRVNVLKEISRQNLEVGYFAAEKTAVKEDLRKRPDRFYNYVVVDNVVTNIVRNYDLKEVDFILDRSMSKDSLKHFNDYLERKLSWRQVVEFGKEMPKVRILHNDSRNDQCLQLADYFAGAAFAYFERGERKYFSYIENEVRFKSSWGKISW